MNMFYRKAQLHRTVIKSSICNSLSYIQNLSSSPFINHLLVPPSVTTNITLHTPSSSFPTTTTSARDAPCTCSRTHTIAHLSMHPARQLQQLQVKCTPFFLFLPFLSLALSSFSRFAYWIITSMCVCVARTTQNFFLLPFLSSTEK